MKFSIIIPTYNSEKYLKICLDSVLAMNYPKNEYEVIIVDGGSKDNTLDILKEYDLKLLNSDNSSISNSRNIGARGAEGEHLVFIDSDCIADENLLFKADKNLDRYGCYGAYCKAKTNANWVTSVSLLIESKPTGRVEWLPTGTLCISKEVFREVGGFSEKLVTGEDSDFGRRVRKKGYTIFNDMSVSSVHLGQVDNLKDYFKKEMWRSNSLLPLIKHERSHLPLMVQLNLFHLMLILAFCVSLIIFNNISFLLFVLILVLPLALSIRKSLITGAVILVPQFFLLYFIYFIARDLSLIRSFLNI